MQRMTNQVNIIARWKYFQDFRGEEWIASYIWMSLILFYCIVKVRIHTHLWDFQDVAEIALKVDLIGVYSMKETSSF